MTEREKVTYHLKRMSADFTDSQHDPLHPIQEDIEDAKHLRMLAEKNEAGTLTIKEAEETLELFEGYSPVIIDTDSGRWVEVS